MFRALKNKEVHTYELGLMPFRNAWEVQNHFFQKILKIKSENRIQPRGKQKATPNFLFTVEHPHVYTLGKNGDRKNLLISEKELKAFQAEFIPINRGGDITYHGPGQVVMYPVLDLENFFTDLGKYLRTLEDAVILVLESYGIKAGRLEGYTGVWLNPESETKARKICAMGVKTSRWVTMHGMAFNVNTDLNYFKHIIPCGIREKGVTSLQRELGHPLDLNEVGQKLVKATARLFGMELVPLLEIHRLPIEN